MKFTKKTTVLLAGIVTALAFAGSALAYTSTFDPSTGLGSVAKGDLQQLLYAPTTLNNAQIQNWFTQYGSAATFAYAYQEHWQYYCQFTNGGGQTQTAVKNVQTAVNDTINWTGRGQSNWAGYNLTGLGNTSTTGTVPQAGDDCTVGANSGQVLGDPTLHDSTTPQLILSWDSTSTVIPFTTP